MASDHAVQVGVVGEAVLGRQLGQSFGTGLQSGEHRTYPQLVAVDRRASA
jgi:hypothetical protein